MKTYFELLNGRENPYSDETEEHLQAKVIGPVKFVQVVFLSHIIIGGFSESEFLSIVDDYIFYDGVFYSDISIFDEEAMKEGMRRVVVEQYDSNKSKLNQIALNYLENIKG